MSEKIVDMQVEMVVYSQGKKIPVRITNMNGTIYIAPKGYGDKMSNDGEGVPIVLDVLEGKLELHVWADINEEDQTHTIDLSGAKETKRNQ